MTRPTRFLRMDEAILKSEVSDAITHAMNDLGISKTTLAKKAGIPYATLDRKLKCVGDFGIGELFRIAKALRVPTADLLPADLRGLEK